MTLKDLLRKKHDMDRRSSQTSIAKEKPDEKSLPQPPQDFTFIRTTTLDQEVIQPPSFPGDDEPPPKEHGHFHFHHSPKKSAAPVQHDEEKEKEKDKISKTKKRLSLFRRSSAEQDADTLSEPATPPKLERKLSRRLSALRIRSSSRDSSSSVVPDDLSSSPAPVAAPQSPRRNASQRSVTSQPDPEQEREKEKAWEKRATQLAMLPPVSSPTSTRTPNTRTQEQHAADEDKLQRAITLHEKGELEEATALFGELAKPSGANNTLAQVLYGLALRHGWGTSVDKEAALQFFSLAAAGAATPLPGNTQPTTNAFPGSSPPAAKAELILALYELGNSYRHGWGCAVDPRAARAYYDAAANLGYSSKTSSQDAGDPDALEEAAWCWLTGFGGEKDKRRAAGYLRRAEQLGRTQVGNSWIWKEKYDPPV
ncbi:hypothetical protein ANO11243_089460 [Dothideomycetidae sp. 11243]|nr:hypothetical protein ANO11243_089460 [fungal sp. No.11243]